MRELTLEEVRHVQLSILKRVADFCEEKNLRYYLCAGTMLGAVRHNGYIPWDDDIDIMMPRPDYEELISTLDKLHLKTFHHKAKVKYGYPFLKIGDTRTVLKEDYIWYNQPTGITIDVFPIDGFPSTEEGVNQHLKELQKYKKFVLQKIFTLSPKLMWYKKVILKLYQRIIPLNFGLKKLEEKALKYSFDQAQNFAGLAVWGYDEKEVCPKWIYNEMIKVKFEGFCFNGLKNYDLYLKSLYGDYMELPPKEQQVAKHSFKAFILEGFSLDEIK